MNKHSVKQTHKKWTTVPPVLPPKAMRFNELALRYLSSQSPVLSAAVFNTRVAHLSELLLAFFGWQMLNDIRLERLQKFIYMLEAQGVAARKIQSCLVTFRACMKYGFDQKWLADPVLSKPFVLCDAPLTSGQSFMSTDEYHDLYQDLVQEMTNQTFH